MITDMQIPAEIHAQVRGRKLQPGSVIHTRVNSDVTVPDLEQEPTTYIVTALMHMSEQLGKLAKMTQDHSRLVDEYRPQTLSPDSETSFTIQPTYEVSEKIESIIVTGPAGAVVVRLGDRVWNLTIPATGIIVIAPVAVLLSRMDDRSLTASVAGEYTLELMGHADARYQY